MKKLFIISLLICIPLKAYCNSYEKFSNYLMETIENDPFLSCDSRVREFLWAKADFSNENDPYMKKLDQVSCACHMWAKKHHKVFDLEQHHKELKPFLDKCISLSNSIDL